MAGYSEEEIDTIAGFLKDGLSASQIASNMAGRSRCAIIGIVDRNEKLKAIGFEHKPGYPVKCTRKTVKAKRKAPRPQTQTRKREPRMLIPFKPGRLPKPTAVTIRSLEITLAELEPGQCKFATNNAEPGEAHLFCGRPSKEGSSYCPTHHRIAYQRRKP